jgi:serine/threonine protein kinase
LHEHHILHRDIKLQNIFIDNEGIIKIGGFGLAIKLEQGGKPQKERVGTPVYMAPEILQSVKSSRVGYGLEVDIWAAGVVLYSMIYGRIPFSTKSES